MFFQINKLFSQRSCGIFLMVSTAMLTAYLGIMNIILFYLPLYISIPKNISWFSENLFLDSFLHQCLESSSSIGRYRQYDIFYIWYESLHMISYFHYWILQTEEIGEKSSSSLRKWDYCLLKIHILENYKKL